MRSFGVPASRVTATASSAATSTASPPAVIWTVATGQDAAARGASTTESTTKPASPAASTALARLSAQAPQARPPWAASAASRTTMPARAPATGSSKPSATGIGRAATCPTTATT
jgi:hypothetical protein